MLDRMSWLLCSLFALVPLAAPAAPGRPALPETPRFRQLTVADGLPSDNVNALAEDQHGYLWVGTADGLARYDGVDHRVWRRERGLPDNAVTALHVDAANRLWIGTESGLAVLDSERAGVAIPGGGATPFPADRISALASTPDGAVWAGTSNTGLYRLDGGAVARFLPDADDPRALPSATVYDLRTAPDGALWVSTKGGVARWAGDGFEVLAESAVEDSIVYGIMVERGGRLWIGTQLGVYSRETDGRVLPARWNDDAIGVPGNKIYAPLHRDRNGFYWLDTRAGLALGDREQARIVPVYSQVLQGPVLPALGEVLEDRGGGLWFASDGAGLWYLPPNWHRFAMLARREGEQDTLGNADITAMAAGADGAVWLHGSSGVLDRLDPLTGQVEHVHYDRDADYVPDAVLEDAGGDVWFAYYGGVARLARASGELRAWSYLDAVDAAIGWPHVGLAQDGDGLVWAATQRHGLQARDRSGRVREQVVPGDGRGLDANAMVHAIERAPDGGLWVAADQGLLMWNAGARRFEPVPGAGGPGVVAFASGDGETVWLVRDGRLESYRWDGAELELREVLDGSHGLPPVPFNGITVDGAGLLWLTCQRGLVRVDPRLKAVQVFGASNGLPGQNIRLPPLLRQHDGRILIATPGSLVVFDPAAVGPAEAVPNLVVESVGVRRAGTVEALDPGAGFVLRHGDRDLRVVARLLNFNDARNNSYRFRLHGYDSDWVEVGASGERAFSLLAPGRYRLEIVARTAQSLWSDPLELAFEVAPPWWRSWWASALLLVVVALLLGAGALGWQRRVRRRMVWERIRHENEVARKASEAKTRFLATLGHEVRTPMTGVLGMSELLLETPLDGRQRRYTESIQRAGDHLMRLVNDALDLARIEAGKLQLDPQPFDLHQLLDDVAGLMGPGACQRGLEFRLEVAGDLPRWIRGDPVRVRQILLNLLGNATKFTEAGRVALAADRLADGLRFVVADTGPGLNEEQKRRLFRRFEQAEGARTAARYGGSGLGLAICQELAAAMGGRIDVDSAPGEGTRFIVELPLPVASAPQAPQPDAARPAGAFRLLLVEDDPTVAEVISGLLRAQGHEVAHVAHGLAALMELSAHAFDVLLLDLDLPGIDGLALARQLRAQGRAQPLVAITARADAEAEPLARAAGFDAFLRKPVTGQGLAETLAAVRPGVRAPA
ncbi:two-component regulator propeller domain-containing protein [Luteimonas sp. RD2P54]|uniref:histidine kinase n=1 Tax=Luteimonas endophytica TaxID=3042023 RepID=A0ABT6JAB6_9GAMM|nr:two-component regulator propeller domain-containing protein [Luteimonas endophytica]MDH5823520.1 two-component regulator propeller domain-containing protein [Luteimonas endophytica]